MTIDQYKKKVFEHPLFSKLKIKYPLRDYSYQIEIMWDWWESKKKKPPISIAALDNWLKRSQPDPDLVSAHKDKLAKELEADFQKKYGVEYHGQNEEGLKRLKELKEQYNIK